MAEEKETKTTKPSEAPAPAADLDKSGENVNAVSSTNDGNVSSTNDGNKSGDSASSTNDGNKSGDSASGARSYGSGSGTGTRSYGSGSGSGSYSGTGTRSYGSGSGSGSYSGTGSSRPYSTGKSDGRSSGNADRGDSSFQTRFKFSYKEKECFFTKNKYIYIDYKDVVVLRRFVSRSGRILPQRFTNTTKTWHRKLVKAIKKARYMALLPYINKD